jgi:CheY-like chemotaxis protein
MMQFVLNQPIDFEESLICEFKEVKTQPLQTIGKVVDEYVVAFLNETGGSIYWGIRDHDRVVTGVPVTDKSRDELKQVIGQKVAAIAPPVSAAMVHVPFHQVQGADGNALAGTCVVEVRVTKPQSPGLFLTGSGEAYRKTIGGIKKLSGAELFMALGPPLQVKMPEPVSQSLLAQLPGLHRRAMLVQPLVQGRRVLWVDDQPSNNFYERLALAQLGVSVDVATSSDEGLNSAKLVRPDVIVSDMNRHGQQNAGLQFMAAARAEEVLTPIIYYTGYVDEAKGVPPGAFGITDRPDEVLHLILDVLERRAG